MTSSNQKNYPKTAKSQATSIGGRTTISPPAKISQESQQEIEILASNIDTLRLSINIVWENSYFFAVLSEAKTIARLDKIDLPVPFIINDTDDEYFFSIKEHGSQGYEWILNNSEYSLLIGNWRQPQSRPSVLLTIRSETLWRKGPFEAIFFIINFLKKVGGKLTQIKISRLDLCVDTLFPEKLWSVNILDHRVTRASDTKIFHSNKNLSGITIGKNKFSARLYDKPLEIQQQSNKTWFFNIWGLESVPADYKIIRVEFQLRREDIKELGIISINDLFNLIQNIWSYCTKDWLKFQDNPGKQSHQRKTLKWWEIIQNGFNNMSPGNPLIRSKALNADKDRLSQQIVGLMSSFAALEFETGWDINPKNINLINTFKRFQRHFIQNNLNKIEFSERVENKKAKFQRLNNKHLESLDLRKELGFLPNNAA
ncbi:hypothetical protein [Desulfobacula toluolica]|uniref:Conserved uncharacterized protein n=1 Tax=Desulfobacula toluolica (strain DSM 7467 / Tol2) TaxID=651182 RepID=K0NNJ2_DESTT|nr:hypothetical protein [Desulfobacula toluolica]CCK81563.1 conserved uncharacterized protein [Desulfobacula toluolica Tol2]